MRPSSVRSLDVDGAARGLLPRSSSPHGVGGIWGDGNGKKSCPAPLPRWAGRLFGVRAEILSVGTELLLGQIVDTNANYLAQSLPGLGIDLYFISQIGDNLGRLTEAIQRALGRSDLIVITGGLGPTEDDLTREGIAAALREEMTVDPRLEAELRAGFTRRNRPMPERNVKQATTIPSSTPLPNPVGTAPGWWVENNGGVIVAMPGVPHEMDQMWREQALPRLARRVGAGAIESRTLKLVGLGESNAEEDLGDLVHSLNPTLATYAKPDGVHLRVTAKAATRDEAFALVAQMEERVRERVGDWLYGADDQTLSSVVGDFLRVRGWTLATAESATAGGVASLITDAPGASDYLVGGAVVYSRAAKRATGVPASVLDQHGTISEETTRALATAVRHHFSADVGLATTGVAGPGPSEGKDPGTLYVALDMRGQVTAVELRYRGNRQDVKRRGSLEALAFLWRALRD